MRKVMTALVAFEAVVSKTALVIATVFLVALACTCLWQVLSRSYFDWPIDWAEPTMRYLMIWCVFLAMPTAFRSGAMVSVDFLPSIAGRARPALMFLIGLICVGFLGLCLYAGLNILPRVGRQTIVGLKGLTMFWVYLAVPVGMALSILSVGVRLLRPLDAPTAVASEIQL